MLKKLKSENSWTYQYGESMITVQVNRIGMKLIVNGQEQDKKQTILSAGALYLKGQLESGEVIIAHRNDDGDDWVGPDIDQWSWSVIVGPKLNEITASN